MTREPAKIQVVGGISFLLFTFRIILLAPTRIGFPSLPIHSQEMWRGGPWGGSHLSAALEYLTGSPGWRPSMSRARWTWEGLASVRRTDSCSVVPARQQKNS